MNLLMLIHRLPCPPDRGAKLRAAAELRWLARRHDVWCAGFVDPAESDTAQRLVDESLRELRAACRDVAVVALSPWRAAARAILRLGLWGTATEGYFASRTLQRQVMRWADRVRFDAVLAFSSGMAPLALQVPARRHVLDLVDVDSRKWSESHDAARPPMRWVYGTEARRLARREEQWIQAFDASVVCTQREADLVASPACRCRVHVIPTGASLDIESACSTPGPDKDGPLPDEPIVGFLGAMDYPPNVQGVRWFAEAIWPRIQQRRTDARWWIVGRSPDRSVWSLHDGRSVRVTGTVPAVEPYLQRMRVNVAPLRLARGVQTKVLTAMAAGRPCVVTSCVAAGLGAEAGREILVADRERDFADAVTDLLADRSRAEAIGRAGRAFVQRCFAPAAGLARLERLLQGDVC